MSLRPKRWASRWETICCLAARHDSSIEAASAEPPPSCSMVEPTARALDGAVILVTRPARQAAALVSRIAALGGSAIVFPAIAILPPDDPASVPQAHAAVT